MESYTFQNKQREHWKDIPCSLHLDNVNTFRCFNVNDLIKQTRKAIKKPFIVAQFLAAWIFYLQSYILKLCASPTTLEIPMTPWQLGGGWLPRSAGFTTSIFLFLECFLHQLKTWKPFPVWQLYQRSTWRQWAERTLTLSLLLLTSL